MSTRHEIIVGIDLGTTFSAVAYVDDEGRPRLIENTEGKILTPSVVLIEEGQIIVGEAAANQAILKKDNVVRWIKRSIWDESYRFHGMSPVEISAEIVRKLKQDTEAFLGQKIRKAVITCPAYFSSPEVDNTRKAGELAGFEVLEIVREPTAAAVYYGTENLKSGERVLVYDLGGGTFDVTILEFKNGTFRPLASLGDRELGGHDWTSDLLEYVSRQISVSLGEDPLDDPVVHQALYDRCEVAKRDFSKIDRVTISCTIKEKMEQVVIAHETFEEITEPRVQETINWCQQVLSKSDPPLTWSDINKILLVGGSTRLRRVPTALEEATGKKPIRTGEVDTMVALGAAVLAKGTVRSRRGYISKGSIQGERRGLIAVKFERSCPRNLGTRVITWDDSSPKIINSIIIPYGTLIPAEITREDYATIVTNQSYFDVPIVEFDEIGNDVVVGTFRFRCLPNTPAKSKIAVTFKYDKSGVIEVDACDLQSGEILQKEKVEYVEPDLDQIKTSRSPRNVVFALDISGSMSGAKLDKAKQALLETASGLLQQPGNKVGIVTFGSSASLLSELTSNLTNIQKVVTPIYTTGSTAMDEGIVCAAEILGGIEDGAICEIALVTDGMPNDPEAALQAAESAKKAGIKISAVGIGSQDVDEDFLHRIASGVLIIENADQLIDALPNLLMESINQQRRSITWG